MAHTVMPMQGGHRCELIDRVATGHGLSHLDKVTSDPRYHPPRGPRSKEVMRISLCPPRTVPEGREDLPPVGERGRDLGGLALLAAPHAWASLALRHPASSWPRAPGERAPATPREGGG